MGLKANVSTTYTKTEINNSLNSKADVGTTYTKAEVDVGLNDKQRTLVVSLPVGGHPLLTGSRVLKGITAAPPIIISNTDTNLTIGINTLVFEPAFEAVSYTHLTLPTKA